MAESLRLTQEITYNHAHADRDPAPGLYARLKEDGVNARLDTEKLLPGQDWELEIHKAIAKVM